MRPSTLCSGKAVTMTSLVNHLGMISVSEGQRLIGRIDTGHDGAGLFLYPLTGVTLGRTFRPLPITREALRATVSPEELSNFMVRLTAELLRTGIRPQLRTQMPPAGQKLSLANSHWYEPTIAMLEAVRTVAGDLHIANSHKLLIIYYRLFHETAATLLGVGV